MSRAIQIALMAAIALSVIAVFVIRIVAQIPSPAATQAVRQPPESAAQAEFFKVKPQRTTGHERF